VFNLYLIINHIANLQRFWGAEMVCQLVFLMIFIIIYLSVLVYIIILSINIFFSICNAVNWIRFLKKQIAFVALYNNYLYHIMISYIITITYYYAL